jgi:hypothetical protein
MISRKLEAGSTSKHQAWSMEHGAYIGIGHKQGAEPRAESESCRREPATSHQWLSATAVPPAAAPPALLPQPNSGRPEAQAPGAHGRIPAGSRAGSRQADSGRHRCLYQI